MTAPIYHLLTVDLAQMLSEDEPVIMAALDEARERFREFWCAHDLRHLLIQSTVEGANRVLDGFTGFLRSDVAEGEPLFPLVISTSDFAALKLACVGTVPLFQPFNLADARTFPEIALTMVVTAMVHESAILREQMAEVYIRLHHITGVDDEDGLACLQGYMWEQHSGLHEAVS